MSRADIEVVFTVDMFNEGLDLPGIDTVLMLRPTESPVIFLQQLGRGLRSDQDKEGLTVIDLIGNHRSFLIKPRTLLSLGAASTPSVAAVLAAMTTGDFELPPGCSVSYELGLVDMFRQLVRLGGNSGLEEYCRSHTAEEGIRPSAMQAFAAGFNPTSVRSRYGSWFGFLDHLDMLGETESNVVSRHGDILAGLEAEPATKAYKLVTLRALLRDGTLRTGSPIDSLAKTAHRLTVADPRLVDDARSAEMPDPASVADQQWMSYWRRWPLAAWSGELKGQPGRWFTVDGDSFVPRFSIEDRLGEAFDEMVAEMVEFRLARHLAGKTTRGAGEIILRVGQTNGRPLVWLDRPHNPQIPQGDTEFLANNRPYIGNFAKIALNTAFPPGERTNGLHSLLRRWFGPLAGHAGTSHHVVLRRVDSHWEMTPVVAAAATSTEAS